MRRVEFGSVGPTGDDSVSRCTSDRGSRKAKLEEQGTSFACDITRRWACGPVLTPCPYLLSQRPSSRTCLLRPHGPWWGAWTRPVPTVAPARPMPGGHGV